MLLEQVVSSKSVVNVHFWLGKWNLTRKFQSVEKMYSLHGSITLYYEGVYITMNFNKRVLGTRCTST